MSRKKPRIERECLVCGTTFTGTPAATRCPSCRAAGNTVSYFAKLAQRRGETATADELVNQAAERKALAAQRRIENEALAAQRKAEREARAAHRRAEKAEARANRPQHEKTCHACGEHFTTPKANTVRCGPCIAEGREVKHRQCLECRASFPVIDDSHVNCPTCAEMLGVEQYELTPEQAERLAEEERRARTQARIARQAEWLDQRERKPKGRKAMTRATAKTPVGILWLQLCAADGAAASVLYAGANTDLSEDEKLSLLSSFHRLRVRGYHPDALAKLCPAALLRDETRAAIPDLPQVTPGAPEDDAEWVFDPFAGDEYMCAEIAKLTEDAARLRDAVMLGLA